MTRRRHKTNGRRAGEIPALQVQQDAYEQIANLAPKEREHRTGPNEVQKVQVKLRRFAISWAFPLDEILFSKFFVNFLALPVMPWDHILTAQSTYLPDARNTLHSNFLQAGSKWLVMLDSDVLPPPNFLDRLLSHKLPMVGGWYRKKKAPFHPIVYDRSAEFDEHGSYKFTPRIHPGKGLEKVDAAGAGCWLMSREVAVAIGEQPYDMLKGGEDLALCEKVRAAGFDIYIDWDVACAHAGVSYV